MQFDSDLFSVVVFFFAVVFERTTDDASVLDFWYLYHFCSSFVLPLLLLLDSIGIRGKSQMKIKDVQNVRFLPFKWSD